MPDDEHMERGERGSREFRLQKFVQSLRSVGWLAGLCRHAKNYTGNDEGVCAVSENGHGNGAAHRPTEEPEEPRSQVTQEWDALVADVQQGVIDDLKDERQQQTTGTRIEDGPHFPAFRVGPQASRDPRFVGPDWRTAAPLDSDAYKEAQAHPVSPYDKDTQKILKAVFVGGQPPNIPER
jgi:hypothetical protein